ncbi:MAG: hypothetical protein DSM107014_09805 [Gomphosphaeria aponina SAG 52.96 = DSM 107014]|uniref:Uncharacterized protein n=1 Tax=Gomphosphaeria aponina SAG 52.96 = DSM 107014 TaxID=1521640 RepID=A0A941GY55_9CHRO|nr:hypothetical protein [Gomphosphaeria aponina SAG 52.96 = DSM 107014]
MTEKLITNAQECQNLIQKINSAIADNPGFMKNPEEQYQQRNNYIEILEYGIKNNELYHLYDIWQVFAQAREEATRGFFLDLWDIYEKKEGEYKNQRERNILRHFVGQINNQFDEILLAKKITAPKLWEEYIQEILRELMWIENEQEMQLQRKLLYSMSNLYVYLYPNNTIPVEEEKEALISQLETTKAAIYCRAKENNFSVVLDEVFGNRNNENSDLQRKFTRAFLYLYRFVNHFALISLEEVVEKAIASLQEEEFIQEVGQETGKELLDRLLRYWGSTAPLMKLFLLEKLDFKFYEYHQPEAIKLPAPYGTDNFVYTIGASGVGKTYFFQAMEYFSTKEQGQLPLSIEYIDSLEKKKLNRKKWEQQEELEAEENHLIYLHSKVRNLCRFTFYKIEDTQIIIKDSTITKWQSLQAYFERRLPVAIVLVFSPEEKDNLQGYDSLVNLLEGLEKKDERYRNIPIYFIFNQSDKLLANIQAQEEYDQEMLDEFKSYLNSEVELSKGFNFFSLRYQKEVKNNDVLAIANQTKACCNNLAFIAQLDSDLQRVKNIISSFLNANFTNLSFMYTSSLFNPDRQYTDLQNLWSDLNHFLIKATSEELEKYYQQEFKRKLKNDFLKVNLFCNEAEITNFIEISKGILQRLNKAPDSEKMKEYFSKIKKKIDEKNNEIDVETILSLNSGFKELEDTLKNFVTEKEYIRRDLHKLLKVNLKELGVPVEKSNNEDFPLKEIEFIIPETINYYDEIWQFNLQSPIVKNFIKQREYEEVTEEVKNIVFQRISDYNKNKIEKDRLKIDKDSLKIIIEQLPKQFQAIDLAKRNEAFEASIKEKFLFADALNITSALCLIQSGQFDHSDRSLIQGSVPEQTVLERLCQFTNFEEAKKYCQLLSNYLPKYPNKPKYSQFILVKRHSSDKIQVELDEIKINVIRHLDEKLKQQQKLLLDMLEILLENWRKFNNLYEKREFSNLYAAQYLLKILELHNFNTENFKKEPLETIKKIANAINNLIKIMEGYKTESDKNNLEGFNNDYQQIKLSPEWLLLNVRDLDSRGKEIEIELKTAFNIYNQIFNKVKNDKDSLNNLSEAIIQKFSFLQTNEYNNLLKDYERQRKLLFILERVEYLRTSKWIEDLQWLNDSFSSYTDVIWGNLTSIGTRELDEWKELFIKNIDKLLETELFSDETE